MAQILVVPHPEDNVLVVDSRLVAARLEVNHSDWMQNIIRKYQESAEQAFGSLRFENEVKKRDIGATTERFVWLTEEQSTFYMTLSKNTPRVVECKVELVKAFFLARQLLRQRGVVQQHSSVYIRRLENIADHQVPDDLWTTFREGAEILLLVEKQYKVPVDEMDLCDGSIGNHWSQHRWEGEVIGKGKLKSWARESGKYVHRYRDRRGEQPGNAYQYIEIPVFKVWLRDSYIPQHLPQYLVKKFGKRAVRQIYEEQGKLNDYILEITNEKRTSLKQEEMYEVFLAAREAIANRYLLGE